MPDAPASPRRKPVLGCAAFCVCFLLFVVYAIRVGGEPARQAGRFRQTVQPGMTLAEVLPVPQGRWVVLASPKNPNSGDAVSIANVSNGAVMFKRGGQERLHRSQAEFVEAMREQDRSLSADWNWSFTFFGLTPGRVTVTVTFDAEGRVESVSPPRAWD